MDAWIRPLVALSLLFPLIYGEEFRVGQTVLVVPEEISLRKGTEVVATAKQGDSLSIIKVQGRWVGVLFKGKKGWVRADQVQARPRVAPKGAKPLEPLVQVQQVERTVTFSGHFTEGGHRKQHALRGVFNRTTSDRWDAAFHFLWSGKKHMYKGTITGNLRNGPVQGQARSGARSWVFEGRARNGALTCKHYETTGGKRRPTGDFVIRR